MGDDRREQGSKTMSFQPEQTKLLGVDDEQTRGLTYEVDEQAAREAEEARQFERAARDRALGSVPLADATDLPPPLPRPDNDKFLGSAGLLVLRLVLAAFIGVRGIQVLFDLDGATDWLTQHNLPSPVIIAWVLGIGLLLCTLMLLFGFGTRTASLIVAVLAIAVLVFVEWGAVGLFVSGRAGFVGDTELLTAGAALALVFLGSGGWAVDGAMRHSRWQDSR